MNVDGSPESVLQKLAAPPLLPPVELNFDVRKEEGLLVVVCHKPEMATQGRTMEELIQMVRELIHCHFYEGGKICLSWENPGSCDAREGKPSLPSLTLDPREVQLCHRV